MTREEREEVRAAVDRRARRLARTRTQLDQLCGLEDGSTLLGVTSKRGSGRTGAGGTASPRASVRRLRPLGRD